MTEVDEYNECFPGYRKSNVIIELTDGSVLESGTTEAAGDPEMPFSTSEIEDKFVRFASKPLGEEHALQLKAAVLSLGSSANLDKLNSMIYQKALE